MVPGAEADTAKRIQAQGAVALRSAVIKILWALVAGINGFRDAFQEALRKDS